MPRGKDLKKRQPRCDKQSPFDLVHCKDCEHVFRRQELSKAGLCVWCGVKRVSDGISQMRGKRGEIYEKWLSQRGQAAIKIKGGING